MDPRRLVTLGLGVLLAGAAYGSEAGSAAPGAIARDAVTPHRASRAAGPVSAAVAKLVTRPVARGVRRGARARSGRPPSRRPIEVANGQPAILAATRQATDRSRADRFVGGLQVFAYAPGRIYEVWTAPLRVTSLTLAPGETVVSLAAGDTVRWQIGETASGAAGSRRVHILLKPLERGLETNLVVTTSQRLYLLRLRSGPPETFNPAVAWAADALAAEPPPGPASAAIRSAADQAGADGASPAPPSTETLAADRLDARYRIAPRGRRPAWTPTAVMTDGRRTVIAFPDAVAHAEAPALFAVAPSGEAQMINYRQQPGLYIVDRVLDRAELRLGAGRSATVRLERLGDRP